MFLCVLITSSLAGWYTSYIKLPCPKEPILLYSNQAGCDLKALYLKAIASAKKELFLLIYGLGDSDVIESLNEKIAENIKIGIFYDPSGSKKLDRWLPKGAARAIHTSGLMHKKVLSIDNKVTLLGSANLTETSLRLHDNLVAGFYDEGLALYLKAPLAPYYALTTQEQQAEIWSLPHPMDGAINKIITLIDSAKSSIRICMFTFTHQGICIALTEAAHRGVRVEVVLDGYAAEGSSKHIAEALQAQHIVMLKAKKGKLLHHKWCLIDEKTLIMGSTNWTKAAFKKNDDTLIFLDPLTKDQLKTINTIWNKTIRNI